MLDNKGGLSFQIPPNGHNGSNAVCTIYLEINHIEIGTQYHIQNWVTRKSVVLHKMQFKLFAPHQNAKLKCLLLKLLENNIKCLMT